MEANPQAIPELSPQPTPDQTEVSKPVEDSVAGPTAKEMAAAEELNGQRARQLSEHFQKNAEPPPEQSIIGLAAQGMDVLHDAIRAHSNQPTHPDYVPPPRTARQMEALKEELEAGARAGIRARQEQEMHQRARAQQAEQDRSKEGFTTPVYRPGNLVPDPMVAAPSGFAAGTKGFDAPGQ